MAATLLGVMAEEQGHAVASVLEQRMGIADFRFDEGGLAARSILQDFASSGSEVTFDLNIGGSVASFATSADAINNAIDTQFSSARLLSDRQLGGREFSSSNNSNQYKVQAGDTFWDLAKADLGGNASEAEIQARTQQYLAANDGVDPLGLQVGQAVTIPGLIGSDEIARGGYDSISAMSDMDAFLAFNPLGQFLNGVSEAPGAIWDGVTTLGTEAGLVIKDAVGESVFAAGNAITGQDLDYASEGWIGRSIESDGALTTSLKMVGGTVHGLMSPAKAFHDGDYQALGTSLGEAGLGLGAGRALGLVGKNTTSSSNVSGYVFVGQEVNNLGRQGGAIINGKNIRSVPDDVSASFQGNGYLDPLDNTFKPAPEGVTMPVDHILPVKDIQGLPGFNKLTTDQQVAIIHDKINVGNFQPLPKSLNSSKGSKSDASTPWETYKGEKLDSTYQQNLIDTQKDIRKDIQRQINEFRKQNSGNN